MPNEQNEQKAVEVASTISPVTDQAYPHEEAAWDALLTQMAQSRAQGIAYLSAMRGRVERPMYSFKKH